MNSWRWKSLMDIVTQAISSNKHSELCPNQLPLVPLLTSLLRVHLHCEMTQLGLEIGQPQECAEVCLATHSLTHWFPVLPSPPPFQFMMHIIINALLYFLCAYPEPSPRHGGMPVRAVVQQSGAPRFGLTLLSCDRKVKKHIN